MSGFWDDISTDEHSSSQFDLSGGQEQDNWRDDHSEVSGLSHVFSQLNEDNTVSDDLDVRKDNII